jgi:hypothetical protein
MPRRESLQGFLLGVTTHRDDHRFTPAAALFPLGFQYSAAT